MSINQKILLVEDSPSFGYVVKKQLESRLHFEVTWVQSYQDAQACLQNTQAFAFALLDLHLPDAANGEVVDLVLEVGIPTIIFTSNDGNDAQERLWSRQIVDYVFKGSSASLDYIVSLLTRLQKNPTTKLLVVDDSKVACDYLRHLLQIQGYQVLVAHDGEQALRLLAEQGDIRLMLIDYAMPGLSGHQVVSRVRRQLGSDRLAIIGVSALGNHRLSAQFIKQGANDFIGKPFSAEELYCRVAQNLKILEQMDSIRQASYQDFLTGLYNRRYFFEHALSWFEYKTPLTLAMLDIDYFKHINDSYGHHVGDQVLKAFSQLMKEMFPHALLTRMGGEEFCILLPEPFVKTYRHLENFRIGLARQEILIEQERVKITTSIGLAQWQPSIHSNEQVTQDTLEKLLHLADQYLYQAKARGRNCICYGQTQTTQLQGSKD
ncbi:diguanylate cyclase (GGDEF) domain-containing protein [Allopseudospirillum japonicum]|uniref:diguanylate cyclase n=1 Tax=Allopseudospirillum japonicum TaxID=64971 RepID=A0A1H6QS87_9GAMM|nr:diguanylate cyclase [Allopseudospirillum japonicum]SEI46423.1 diguanylate cyclase (GGDEF) domain-containing protein [Allopseudospirillum japonicum]